MMEVVAFYLPSEDKFVGQILMRNAYLVKDYNKFQKLEDEKKKKLLDAKNAKLLTQPKPAADQHDDVVEKPPTGKEKE